MFLSFLSDAAPRPSTLPTPALCPCQVRDHFENNAEAKALLKQVKSYKITK